MQEKPWKPQYSRECHTQHNTTLLLEASEQQQPQREAHNSHPTVITSSPIAADAAPTSNKLLTAVCECRHVCCSFHQPAGGSSWGPAAQHSAQLTGRPRPWTRRITNASRHARSPSTSLSNHHPALKKTQCVHIRTAKMCHATHNSDIKQRCAMPHTTVTSSKDVPCHTQQ
jgi:hypothetical protein